MLVIITTVVVIFTYQIGSMQADIKKLQERVDQLEEKHNGKCKCIQHS